MQLHWAVEALDDVQRLCDFILPHNPKAAAKVVQKLVRAPQMLLEHPRIGEQLFRFYPREIRRLLVDAYEIRYEIRKDDIRPLSKLSYFKIADGSNECKA